MHLGHLLPFAAAVAGAVAGWATGSQEMGWAVLAGAIPAAGLVGVLRPVPVPAITVAALVVAAALTGGASAQRPLEGAFLGTVTALWFAAIAAVPALAGAAVRQRAAHRRRGWELARALAGQEEARVEGAVARERAEMAGEIHDRLGHRLTLIAVRLGRLGLDETVPPGARDTLEEIRADTADAAAELGETVRLLKTGTDRAPVDRPLAEVVEGARRSGLDVAGTPPAGLDRRLGPHAHAAMERVLAEALTNAAKHAPGRRVTVEAGIDAGTAVLTVRNATRAGRTPPPPSGHGLASLRHRLDILGGRLDIEEGPEFVLRARVGADATPAPARDVLVQERASNRHTQRTRRLAWAVPTALTAAAAALAAAFYVYAGVASILSPAEYGRITVGMDRQRAEEMLPATEMLEAPRNALPKPPGATCRFYEASVSFFARDDTYRVCFADGTVIATDVIPAP